jgi:hypothetical protein
VEDRLDQQADVTVADAGDGFAEADGDAAVRLQGKPCRRHLAVKNNTDNKRASYGCHENYLMRHVTEVDRDATTARWTSSPVTARCGST